MRGNFTDPGKNQRTKNSTNNRTLHWDDQLVSTHLKALEHNAASSYTVSAGVLPLMSSSSDDCIEIIIKYSSVLVHIENTVQYITGIQYSMH